MKRPEDIPLLYPDPVIEAYLKDVDRTLIRQQLMRTATERVRVLMAMGRVADEGRKNRERARQLAKAG
jgi:hypothetical protein